MRGFTVRLRRGRSRGIALFSALLGIALFGVLVLALTGFLVRGIEGEKEVGAARKLSVLASAVESYVHSHYGTLEAGGDTRIDIDDLKGEGLLPDGFMGGGDAMKRPLRGVGAAAGRRAPAGRVHAGGRGRRRSVSGDRAVRGARIAGARDRR